MKKTAIYYVNDRRGLKVLTDYTTTGDEICLQIDSSLQISSVNLELASLGSQLASSLASHLRHRKYYKTLFL